MAAAYQLVYDMCEYRKDLRNTWSLKARAWLHFFHILYLIYMYIHTISSLSRSIISLPSCVRGGNPKPYDRYNIPDMWSKHTYTHIHWPYWFMAPRATVRRYHHRAAYAVSVGCYYISIPTDYRRVCAAAKTRKDDSARTYLYNIIIIYIAAEDADRRSFGQVLKQWRPWRRGDDVFLSRIPS